MSNQLANDMDQLVLSVKLLVNCADENVFLSALNDRKRDTRQQLGARGWAVGVKHKVMPSLLEHCVNNNWLHATQALVADMGPKDPRDIWVADVMKDVHTLDMFNLLWGVMSRNGYDWKFALATEGQPHIVAHALQMTAGHRAQSSLFEAVVHHGTLELVTGSIFHMNDHLAETAWLAGKWGREDVLDALFGVMLRCPQALEGFEQIMANVHQNGSSLSPMFNSLTAFDQRLKAEQQRQEMEQAVGTHAKGPAKIPKI